MTDPISDLLTRIRNATQAGHLKVDVNYSKIKAEIVRILKEEGYINNYKITGEGHKRTIRIYIRYAQSSEPAIRHLSRVSRPGRRVYVNVNRIPRPLNGLGTCILSTSRGILTGKEAYLKHVGGEVLCLVY
ncbi:MULTISPECIES: 30S ribosomal protein S8 [Chloracidobacterium]|jgi:small subunit ribosomal protein S8|uniref:30S ribosomal protein S8 n=1 Tax=Chloracidobacterium TaxID=458032 RepID=UPI0009DB3A86|nr:MULTISPECIES: 30S ribosomal protein S8 [Chloracidobacterium]QUV77986.1 30S ribosomal protein S8 [Chloracidobacterium thermophilum]QUV81042.1 30S ribosomal protein S8 [Chloracidobacterium sp. D]